MDELKSKKGLGACEKKGSGEQQQPRAERKIDKNLKYRAVRVDEQAFSVEK